MSALDDVLDSLARAVLPPTARSERLGEITLRPHQVDAARNIESAFAEFGGALLADETGRGKTYVALAVASRFARCVVAAPASLREMWEDASRRARVPIEYVSLEALSRGTTPDAAPLVILDEAHRASTEATERYARLAGISQGARVLLVSATPVRNSGREVASLIGLFLGPDAKAMDDAALSRCVVRGSVDDLGDAIPEIRSMPPIRTRGDRATAAMLRRLPPPLPLADGAAATALVRMTLARAAASSLAALDRSLTRRLLRGEALRSLLSAGRLPFRTELKQWIVGDDSMQLAFDFTAPEPGGDVDQFRSALEVHLAAVEALSAVVRPQVAGDAEWRASRLRGILDSEEPATTIAFTTSETTAAAVFRAMRGDPGVIAVTGRGARSAVGPLSRHDVLCGLAARGGATTHLHDLRLVIATDLLAEGVNLQRASVIVHLDDPWTPSALRQRVGRSARLGSPHGLVTVYRFNPPRAIASLLHLPERHAVKRRAERAALRAGTAADQIRRSARSWLRDVRSPFPAVIAASAASQSGILARLECGTRVSLVCAVERAHRRWTVTDDPEEVRRLAESVEARAVETPRRDEVAHAARAVLQWAEKNQAQELTGTGRAPSANRRRVLARLDRCVANAEPTRRQFVALRVARIRELLGRARGAGLEARFVTLLGRDSAEAGWLDEVERQVAAAGSSPAAATAAPELVSLLFLRGPTGRAPVLSPVPRATSTGTAAPR